MAEGGGRRRFVQVRRGGRLSHFLRYRNARMPPPAANFLSEPLMKIALSAISVRSRRGVLETKTRGRPTSIRVQDGNWLMHTSKI
jgi:hypothetical protein